MLVHIQTKNFHRNIGECMKKKKREGAGVFENLFHAKVKYPFLLRIIVRKMTKLACTCYTRKKKDAYANDRLDYCLNAAELSVKMVNLSSNVSKLLPFMNREKSDMKFINKSLQIEMGQRLNAFVIEVGFATLLLSLNRFLCIFDL